MKILNYVEACNMNEQSGYNKPEEKGKYKLTVSGEEYIEKFVPKESKQRKNSPKST